MVAVYRPVFPSATVALTMRRMRWRPGVPLPPPPVDALDAGRTQPESLPAARISSTAMNAPRISGAALTAGRSDA